MASVVKHSWPGVERDGTCTGSASARASSPQFQHPTMHSRDDRRTRSSPELTARRSVVTLANRAFSPTELFHPCPCRHDDRERHAGSKGMPSPRLAETEFKRRFRSQFRDQAFTAIADSIDKIADAAWDAYLHSRKSPRTRRAGPGYADPDYALADDWLAAHDAIGIAQASMRTPAVQSASS